MSERETIRTKYVFFVSYQDWQGKQQWEEIPPGSIIRRVHRDSRGHRGGIVKTARCPDGFIISIPTHVYRMSEKIESDCEGRE